MDHSGRFPTNEEGLIALLVQPPDDPNWKGPYYKNSGHLPQDPWGSPVLFELYEDGEIEPGATRGRVWSTGPDRASSTLDDIVEKFRGH